MSDMFGMVYMLGILSPALVLLLLGMLLLAGTVQKKVMFSILKIYQLFCYAIQGSFLKCYIPGQMIRLILTLCLEILMQQMRCFFAMHRAMCIKCPYLFQLRLHTRTPQPLPQTDVGIGQAKHTHTHSLFPKTVEHTFLAFGFYSILVVNSHALELEGVKQLD